MNKQNKLQNNILIETSNDVEYYDNYSWLIDYLDIDSWNDKEAKEFIKKYVFFEVEVMSELLHKLNKQTKLELNDSSDFYNYEDSDEDSDDVETYTNYLQFKYTY